jgi:hypothetical protein
MSEYTNEDGVVFEDVDAGNTIYKELLRTYKMSPKDKESALDFTKRVLKRSASGSDDEWNDLSEPTQAWVNAAQEAKDQNPKEFPLLVMDAAAEETSEEEASDTDDGEEESIVENEEKVTKGRKKTAAKTAKVAKTTSKSVGGTKLKAAKASNGGKKTNGGVRGEKIKLIVGLLTRKGGCTARDVLDATGWPAVSMPAMAKQAGLTLNKKKVQGESTVYSAKA